MTFHAQTSSCYTLWLLHVIQSVRSPNTPDLSHIRSRTFQNHFVSSFWWLRVLSWRAACEVNIAESRLYDFIWDDCWLYRTPVHNSFHCLLVSKRKRRGEERRGSWDGRVRKRESVENKVQWVTKWKVRWVFLHVVIFTSLWSHNCSLCLCSCISSYVHLDSLYHITVFVHYCECLQMEYMFVVITRNLLSLPNCSISTVDLHGLRHFLKPAVVCCS